jgi:hypothetical protein
MPTNISQKRTKITAHAIGKRVAMHKSAAFQVEATVHGSLPFPRLTTAQITAIVTPAEGLVAYDLTVHALKIFNGTAWVVVTAA